MAYPMKVDTPVGSVSSTEDQKMTNDDGPNYEAQEKGMGELCAEFYSAFAEVQAKYPVLPRSKTVKVETRTGGSYTFSYAPLEEILRLYRPILAEEGFALTQDIATTAEKSYVETTLTYQNGYSIQTAAPIIVTQDGPQAYSSAVTYARRMGVTLILCLAADDDDDANTAEGNKATVQGHTKASPRDGLDLASVDQELATQYALNIRKAMVAGDENEVKAQHEKLKSQYELYVVVGDKLTSKERADLRKIVSKEKAA